MNVEKSINIKAQKLSPTLEVHSVSPELIFNSESTKKAIMQATNIHLSKSLNQDLATYLKSEAIDQEMAELVNKISTAPGHQVNLSHPQSFGFVAELIDTQNTESNLFLIKTSEEKIIQTTQSSIICNND